MTLQLLTASIIVGYESVIYNFTICIKKKKRYYACWYVKVFLAIVQTVMEAVGKM